jgi:hypothetical protein
MEAVLSEEIQPRVFHEGRGCLFVRLWVTGPRAVMGHRIMGMRICLDPSEKDPGILYDEPIQPPLDTEIDMGWLQTRYPRHWWWVDGGLSVGNPAYREAVTVYGAWLDVRKICERVAGGKPILVQDSWVDHLPKVEFMAFLWALRKGFEASASLRTEWPFQDHICMLRVDGVWELVVAEKWVRVVSTRKENKG